jgi:hypothetical protein
VLMAADGAGKVGVSYTWMCFPAHLDPVARTMLQETMGYERPLVERSCQETGP